MAVNVDNVEGATAGRRRRPRILIVGLGNDLLMDDGVGVHIARRLKSRNLGAGAMAVEVGTAVLDALHLLERAEYVIALDAMQAGGLPGTIYRLSAGDVRRREQLSMHDFTFNSALGLLRKQPREIVFFGIEPQTIDYGMQLAPKVEEAVDLAADEVINLLRVWNGSSQFAVLPPAG